MWMMATSQKMIVKHLRIVTFWVREACNNSKIIPELQWFRFDQNWRLKKKIFFRNSPQNFLGFLANVVYFLDSHLRYAKKWLFYQRPNTIIKKSGSLRTFGSFPEKWQLISWAPGVFKGSKCPSIFIQWNFSKSIQSIKNIKFQLKWFLVGNDHKG